jgi:hypothetical protein
VKLGNLLQVPRFQLLVILADELVDEPEPNVEKLIDYCKVICIDALDVCNIVGSNALRSCVYWTSKMLWPVKLFKLSLNLW